MGLAQASHGPESDLPGPGLGLLDPGVGLSGPGSGLMGGGDVRMDERMNRQQTDGVSPHSTGLCPLSGSLPKKTIIFTTWLRATVRLSQGPLGPTILPSPDIAVSWYSSFNETNWDKSRHSFFP